MNKDEKEDTTIYKVVVNHEDQYSIWPAVRKTLLVGRRWARRGSKSECLAYINEVWTDMRPLSLRRKWSSGKRQIQFIRRIELIRIRRHTSRF